MKKVSQILFAVIFFAGIFSCNKTGFQEEVPENKVGVENHSADKTMSPENPYDYIGQQHNLVLSCLLTPPSSTNIDYACQKLTNEFGNVPNNAEEILHEFFVISFMENKDENLQRLLEKKIVNIYEKEVIAQGLSILEANYNFEKTAKKLLILEHTTLQDKSITLVNKEQALIFLATARYSIQYWKESLDYDSRGPILGIIGIVAADAVGAAVGNEYSGPIGGIILGGLASYAAYNAAFN